MLLRLQDFVKRNRFGFLISGMLALAVSILYFAFTPQLTSFPWLEFLFTLLLFLPFILFLSEHRALREEGKLFRGLAVQKKFLPLALEVLSGAAVTVVFWLAFHKAVPDSTILLDACCSLISLLLMLLFRNVRTSPVFQRILTGFVYLALIIYYIYLLFTHGYTRWTSEGWELFSPFFLNVLPWIHLMLALLVVAEFRTSIPRALFIIAGYIFFSIVAQYAGDILLGDFFALVLLTNLLSAPRVTARVVLGVLISYIVFLAFGLYTGVVDNYQMYFPYGGYTHTLGMGHSNLTALVILSVFLLIWYLHLTNHPIITLVIFLPCSVGLYLLTLSRTAAITLALLPFMNLYRIFILRKKWSRGFKLLTFFPVFIAIVSLVCMYWIPTQQLFPATKTFFARFTIPYGVISSQGYNLLGTILNRDVIILDNLYIHVMIFYGIPSLVIILGLITWVCSQYNRQKQYSELILLITFLIYSFMENALIHGIFGFSLMLLSIQQMNIPRDDLSNPLLSVSC